MKKTLDSTLNKLRKNVDQTLEDQVQKLKDEIKDEDTLKKTLTDLLEKKPEERIE